MTRLEPRVLCLDALQLSKSFEQFQVTHEYEPKSEAELCTLLSDYSIVCLDGHRDSLYLTDEVLKSAHKLLAIGIFGRKTECVDIECARDLGIPVFYAPYEHQHSVSEMVMSFFVLLARQIGDRSMELHQGVWNKVSKGCHELRGKTIGCYGYGHIGSAVGILAEHMGMKVLFYDLSAQMPIGNARSCSEDALLTESDFVCVTIPYVSEPVLGAKEFAKMKKGAYVVNATGGNALDIKALRDHLISGHIAGAALDSYIDLDLSLIKGAPNFIVCPKVGDLTVQVLARSSEAVCNGIIQYLEQGSTAGACNFPLVRPVRKEFSRIVHIHRNVRGVLKEINEILEHLNIKRQMLDTQQGVGYLVLDTDKNEDLTQIIARFSLLSSTIRTRIL